MEKSSVDFLLEKLAENGILHSSDIHEAKQMHKQEIFNALNQSAKEAYEAGQISMACGCYEIRDSMTYEEWLYQKTFKSE